MKNLKEIKLDVALCEQELIAFRNLMTNHDELDEQKHVLPFFKENQQLASLIGFCFPNELDEVNCIAHEFEISGFFKPDLILGDHNKREFVLVEFENGSKNSIFEQGSRATPFWSKRLEGAYSQLIDWFWKLEEQRNTPNFHRIFGYDANFHGLMILGKNMNLSQQEKDRLRWRINRMVVDSKKIAVVSFDDLLASFETRLQLIKK